VSSVFSDRQVAKKINVLERLEKHGAVVGIRELRLKHGCPRMQK
jgi:hypothetical protein